MKETKIYYFKLLCYSRLILNILFLGFGLFINYALLNEKETTVFEHCLFLIFVIAPIYLVFDFFKKATNNQVQILISIEGIETFSTKLKKWEEIKNEKVIKMRSGKSNRSFLVYDFPSGSEKVLIDYYDTDEKSLGKLLIKYRELNKLRSI